MTGGTIAGNRAYSSAGVDIGRGGLVEITGEVDDTFRMQGGSIEGTMRPVIQAASGWAPIQSLS